MPKPCNVDSKIQINNNADNWTRREESSFKMWIATMSLALGNCGRMCTLRKDV